MGMDSIQGAAAHAPRLPAPTYARSPKGEAAQAQQAPAPAESKAAAPLARPKEAVENRPAQNQVRNAPPASAASRTGMKYHVDENTEMLVVELLSETREVIKQIPPEEILKAAAKVRGMQAIVLNELA